MSSVSDRQPELFSEALVECKCRDEAAQKTDLACHFSGRITPLWSGVSRSGNNCLCHHVGRVAYFHCFLHDYIHASARRVIYIEHLIRLGEIVFERRPGVGWLHQRNANAEGAQFVIERFGITLDGMFGRRVEREIGSGDEPCTELKFTILPFPWRRITGNTALVTRKTPKTFTSNNDLAWAIEDSSAPPSSPMPALLTRRSMRPASASTSSTSFATDASSVTSQVSMDTPSLLWLRGGDWFRTRESPRSAGLRPLHTRCRWMPQSPRLRQDCSRSWKSLLSV